MKVFYDTEFIEDGRTIDLISIGMVRENGDELYLVNADAPLRRAWWAPWRKTRVERHPWLMDHVVPYLPRGHGDWRLHMPRRWLVDFYDARVLPKRVIAKGVREFLLDGGGQPELWAYYGAYDHVALAQLFGPMVDMPRGIPWWTNDIRQEAARLGIADISEHVPPVGARHNALDDARHVKAMHEYLQAVVQGRPEDRSVA